MECNTVIDDIPDDNVNTISCKYVWSNDKKDEFISKLNAALIQEVVVELDMLLLAIEYIANNAKPYTWYMMTYWYLC